MASKNGQLTFNFALLVPAENAAAVEEIIATHAAWMKETHSLEAGSGIHLVDYHMAKGEEANDLLDKAKKAGKLDKDAKPTADNLRKIGVKEEKAEQLAEAVEQNEKQQQRVQNDNALLTGFGNNGGEEYLSYLMTSESLVITGGNTWKTWDEKMHRRLRKIQSPNGSWTGHHCITRPVFCTAAGVQCLNTYRDAEMLREAALASSRPKTKDKQVAQNK